MNDDEVNVELGGKQNYEKVEQVDGKKYEDDDKGRGISIYLKK